MTDSICYRPDCKRHALTVDDLLARCKRLDNGCLEWPVRWGRYGSLSLHKKQHLAHRFIEQMVNGPLGPDEHVLHTCDNGHCVNPDHLRRGTHADNMADMVSKRRARALRGEQRSTHKLTERDVRAIRREYRWGSPDRNQFALAAKYGVSQALVKDILHRKRWAHLED